MGLKPSKNPLVIENFDGQSGDHTVAANNYQTEYGPEWVINPDELSYYRDEIRDLDNAPKELPMFSWKGTVIPAKAYSVYDGDTCNFVVKFNGEWVRKRFRLIGYNSPEILGKTEDERLKAKAARDYLANRLLGKKVLLYLGDFDKFGRPLCDVYLIEDESKMTADNMFSIHINAEMIAKGHGVPFMVGRGLDMELDQ